MMFSVWWTLLECLLYTYCIFKYLLEKKLNAIQTWVSIVIMNFALPCLSCYVPDVIDCEKVQYLESIKWFLLNNVG